MLPRIKNMKLTAKVSKNILLKLALVFGSIFGVFLMTGLLYFRADVYITDNGETKQVFTMSEDPYAILSENHYKLSSYDQVNFSGFENNIARITIDRAFEVPVRVDGETKTGYTLIGTVGDLLEQCGVTLGKYDSVSPSKDTVCKKGMKVSVARSYKIDITADGKTISAPALNNTVEEVLEQAGIEIGVDDIVTPELDTKVSKTTEIVVKRVTYKDYTTQKTVNYKTVTEEDNLLPMGTETVKVEGKDGITRYTRRKTYVDGVEVSNKVIKTTVVQKKIDEVISRGAALAEPYSKVDDDSVDLVNGRPEHYEYVISGKATAYTAKEGAKTASGRYAEIGTVAVNPNVIPYGSKLYIVTQDGSRVYGYAVAADTGDGMMDGSLVADLYMGPGVYYYNTACEWGLKYVDIYVLEVGNG